MDAEAWLVDERRLIAAGKWVAPERRQTARHTQALTLAEYAAAWVAGRDLKPRTRALYTNLLQRHIASTLGDRPLVGLTAADVRAWHVQQGQATPTATAHAYALLRSILATAVEDELRPTNPCRIRGAAQTKRVHHIEPATLEQLEAILAAMPARYHLMILLASWCALRFGELTELRRRDVDLKASKIKVSRGVTWVAGEPVIGPPKSDAGVREVAIPPHLLEVVREHLDNHMLWGKDALLFTTASGHQIGRGGAFQKHWEKARAAAGRPDLRFHDLRHTGAVLYALTGATLAELMGRLGHSTPAMAIRYQHVAAGRDTELARRMSDLATRQAQSMQ
jgi:integrase